VAFGLLDLRPLLRGELTLAHGQEVEGEAGPAPTPAFLWTLAVLLSGSQTILEGDPRAGPGAAGATSSGACVSRRIKSESRSLQ